MHPQRAQALAAAATLASRVVAGARESVQRLVSAPQILELRPVVAERGYFRPTEDELVDEWFARLLNLRAALWEVIDVCGDALGGDTPAAGNHDELRVFVGGYAAACLVAKLDRFVVEDFATHRELQRKLNEPRPAHRIARKQFTRIFESLTDPEKALRMKGSIDFVRTHLGDLEALSHDPDVGAFVQELEELESVLDTSKRRYLELAWAFMRHSWARRGASAKQKATGRALEGGGRVASEVRDRSRAKRVSPGVQAQLAQRLRPGDVLVTRHDGALTNLFLPGFWPHAALFIGSEAQREALGVRMDEQRSARAAEPAQTLEALKDGVRFRPLAETLAVDAVTVLRPRLEPKLIARGIERAAQHEGKHYNFDFDFFRADRLVCTEVVFRAFDGLGDFELPLVERARRPSLSAEDLLDHALRPSSQRRAFDPIALYGAGAGGAQEDRLVEGEGLAAALAATYKGSGQS